MQLRVIMFAVFTLGLLLACDQDDTEPQTSTTETAKSFRVIGEDAEAVYQFEYDPENENQTLNNLTQETGVLPDYLTLRQLGETVSFYSFRDGLFSLLIKNLESGSVEFYDEFYANGPDRSVAWGINTLTDVYFGYFTPGSRNLAIQKVSLEGINSIDIIIDFNIDVSFQPLFFEDKIFVSYRDNLGNYKITYYNTLNDTLGPILNFENIPVSFLIDASGELVVINNIFQATMERYDATTLILIEEKALDFGTGFLPGPMEGTVLADENLFFAYNYVQPASYPYGPAIFDLISQENNILDFPMIANTVESELETSIGLITQVYDLSKGVFLIGYSTLGEEVGGGVLQVSTSGKLIANIELPFLPTYFIRD